MKMTGFLRLSNLQIYTILKLATHGTCTAPRLSNLQIYTILKQIWETAMSQAGLSNLQIYTILKLSFPLSP